MPKKEGDAAPTQHIVHFSGVPAREERSALEAVEAESSVTRESLLCRIAKVWYGERQKA